MNSAAAVAVVVAALLAVVMQWPFEGERPAPAAKKRTTEPVATTPGPGGSAGRAPQRDDG